MENCDDLFDDHSTTSNGTFVNIICFRVVFSDNPCTDNPCQWPTKCIYWNSTCVDNLGKKVCIPEGYRCINAADQKKLHFVNVDEKTLIPLRRTKRSLSFIGNFSGCATVGKHFCNGHGICRDKENVLYCDCEQKFTGAHCFYSSNTSLAHPCNNTKGGPRNPCRNNGTCHLDSFETPHNYTCECVGMYQGMKCHIDSRRVHCSGLKCHNQGEATYEKTDTGINCLCNCSQYFLGEHCDIVSECREWDLRHWCGIGYCKDGRLGSNHEQSPSCNCPNQYDGPNCTHFIGLLHMTGTTGEDSAKFKLKSCQGKCKNGGTCFLKLSYGNKTVAHGGMKGEKRLEKLAKSKKKKLKDEYGEGQPKEQPPDQHLTPVCICPSDYSGDNCTEEGPCKAGSIDIGELCGKGASSAEEKKCLLQFSFTTEDKSDDKVSRCQHGTCHASSAAKYGFACTCNSGYQGERCNLKNPCFEYELIKVKQGEYKEIEVDRSDNEPQPCRNGGTCIPIYDSHFPQSSWLNSYRCLCPETTSGKYCQKVTSSACQSGKFTGDVCKRGGVCTTCSNIGKKDVCKSHQSRSRGYICKCPAKPDGTPDHSVHCDGDDHNCRWFAHCRNGGTCIEHGSSPNKDMNEFECKCPRGFVGHDCSNPTDQCALSPCFYGSTCLVISKTKYKCNCAGQMTGIHCEKSLDPEWPYVWYSFHTIVNISLIVSAISWVVILAGIGFLVLKHWQSSRVETVASTSDKMSVERVAVDSEATGSSSSSDNDEWALSQYMTATQIRKKQ